MVVCFFRSRHKYLQHWQTPFFGGFLFVFLSLSFFFLFWKLGFDCSFFWKTLPGTGGVQDGFDTTQASGENKSNQEASEIL